MERYVKYLRKSRFDRDYAELSIEETLKRLEYKIAFYDDKLSKRDGEAQENHQGTKREDRASR